MSSRVLWFGLAAIATLGLFVSHYLCFRKGQGEEMAELAPAIERQKNSIPHVRLSFALKALRPVAQHPDAVSPADAAELCRQAEEFARAIEKENIPEMRAAGNKDGVRRQEELIREARDLIGRIKR